MTREETIDKIMRDLGGRSITEENHKIDYEEVKASITKLFMMSANMHIQAELFKDELDGKGKWFCENTSELTDLLRDIIVDLSLAIFGKNATKELVVAAERLTNLMYHAAIEEFVNKEVRESDLN